MIKNYTATGAMPETKTKKNDGERKQMKRKKNKQMKPKSPNH